MKVFISYRSNERPLVEKLSKDLEAFGHQVWYDKKLTGGQEWWQEIISQIYQCDLFVAALSPKSLASEPCRLEREYARRLNKRILPVVIAKIDYNLLSSELKVVQTVNFNQDRQAVIDLGRALNSLPPVQPLPNPLPAPPPVPIDNVVTDLQQRIAAVSLPYEEQLKLTDQLKSLLRDPEKSDSARLLLEQLRRHHDLRASVAEDISGVLSSFRPIASRRTASGVSRSGLPAIYRYSPFLVGALLVITFFAYNATGGRNIPVYAALLCTLAGTVVFAVIWVIVFIFRLVTGRRRKH